MLGGVYTDVNRVYSQKPANVSYELEAKFRTFMNNKVSTEVPLVYYERLRKNLSLFTDIRPITKVSTVSIDTNNVRKICVTQSCSDDDITNVRWERKQNLLSKDINDYDVRISVSAEQPIQAVENFSPTLIRDRNRTSYEITLSKLSNGQIPGNVPMIIDMSEIMSIAKTCASNATYEVEVELAQGVQITPQVFQEFEQVVSLVYMWLRGTHTVYTSSMKTGLISRVNTLLKSTIGPNISKDEFVQARNIKKEDLVYGGIVGGKFKYAVTIKADGVRKFLVFDETGIWLIYPPFEYNLVIPRGTSEGIDWTKVLDQINGTIVDCEVVTPKDSNIPAYLVVGFDTLTYLGKDVRSNLYFDRLKVIESLTAINTKVLRIVTKPTEEILSPEDYFGKVSKFLELRKTMPYKQDGLMFVPINGIYNPRNENNLTQRQRVLTTYQDICKWKDEITIDFIICWRNEDTNIKVQLLVAKDKQLVPFTGNNKLLVTDDMIDSNDPLIKDQKTGTVVEYALKTIQDEPKIYKLVPVKLRHDKNSANTLETALANWDDIINHLDADDISGKSLKLMSAYHNRVKDTLFDTLKKTDKILDIGSGRGGDVSKWKQHTDSKIVAVEPNEKNRAELNRRIQLNGMSSKVVVVPTGGEDTPMITDQTSKFLPKADVISLMLSLSFFWKSPEMLDALVNTIVSNVSPGGTIIFNTIDGTKVRQLFTGDTKSIVLYPVSMKLVAETGTPFGNQLDIVFPKTIVGEQTEYLVYMNALTERLAKYGFTLEWTKVADAEKLLTPEQMKLSSCYTYGVYRNTNPSLITSNLNTSVTSVTSVSSLTEGVNKLNINEPSAPEVFPRSPDPGEMPLASIPVEYLNTQGVPFTTAAVNDDSLLPLTCTWQNNLARIATIGGGDCFMHAVLKCFYGPYQENFSASNRWNLGRSCRVNLSAMLTQENPKYPGFTYWETVGNGQFISLYVQQLLDPSLIGLMGGVSYSPEGLASLIQSTNFLGDEMYQFICDVLNINVIILRSTAKNLYYHWSPSDFNASRKNVVIHGNMTHYEVVALNTDAGLQTAFDTSHEFIKNIEKLKRSPLVNTENYNPNNFLQDISNDLTGYVRSHFPAITDPNQVHQKVQNVYAEMFNKLPYNNILRIRLTPK